MSDQVESATHRLFREAAQANRNLSGASRRRREPDPPPPSSTFEGWWQSQHPDEVWNETWANVGVVKDIARKAWADGYRQGAEDTW